MTLSPKWQRRLIRIFEILIVATVLIAALILWRWYRSGGGFEAVYVAIGVMLTALVAGRGWLRQNAERTKPNFSEWGPSSDINNELTTLRFQMEDVLNLDDIRILAFDLNLKFDNLAGNTLEQKIVSVLESCKRNGRVPELVQYLEKFRPHVQWAHPIDQTPYITLQAQRNRENLLKQMTTLIDGVLKQSIHHEVIKLNLNYKPEAIGQLTWELMLKQNGQEDAIVPPDRSLLDVFGEAGRNLLILGEPGSGKTTTMLQLAKSLIVLAKTNPMEPLPIILNLSSWAREEKALEDWLVDEMVLIGGNRNLISAGISQNQFVYLLDGLDEVDVEARDACLRAINTFKEIHIAEIVVCSRTTEYVALKNKIHLGTAIQINPLDEAQINAYLRQEKLKLQAVRATLAHDPDLKELARTPLMLSMMTLAYEGISQADLLPLSDKEARRHHLFDHYVRKMFERKPWTSDSPYSQNQALDWLSNLAQGMMQHKQSTFYIERLQPSWVENSKTQRFYNIFFGGLIGIFSSPVFLFFFWTANDFQSVINIQSGFLVFLLSCLSLGLIIGIYNPSTSSTQKIRLVEKINWTFPSIRLLWKVTKTKLIYSIIFGLFGGLLIGLITGSVIGINNDFSDTEIWSYRIVLGIIGGIIFLVLGIFSSLGEGLISYKILYTDPNHSLENENLNVLNLIQGWIITGIIIGLLAAVVLGIGLGLLIYYASSNPKETNILDIVLYLLEFGFSFGLIIGLTSILSISSSPFSQSRLIGSISAWKNLPSPFTKYFWKILFMKLGGSSFVWGVGGSFGTLIVFSLQVAIYKISPDDQSAKEMLDFFDAMLNSGFYVGLIVSLFFIFIDGAFYLLEIVSTLVSIMIEGKEMPYLVHPGQGIANSGRNALVMGFLFGISGGLFGLLITDLKGGIVGSVIGIWIAMFNYGGFSFFHHYVLRFSLAWDGTLPYPFLNKRLVAFLDDMQHRILLQRVGGGWIFVHRYLLEYFATLEKDKI